VSTLAADSASPAREPLVLSVTLPENPYWRGDLAWRGYGTAGYRLVSLTDGKQVGLALSDEGGGWTFIPEGFAHGVPGLRSLRACKDLFLTQITTSPWFRDPTNASHPEWSIDGVTWHVDPTDAGRPPQARYVRWVGVSMAFELTPRTEPGEPT